MNQINIRCPHCGKELTVPEDAGRIVCMYCAGPIDTQSLNSDRDREYGALAADLEKALDRELFTKQIHSETFNQTHYAEEFEAYRAVFRPALEAFRRAALADEARAAQDFGRMLFRNFSEVYAKKQGIFEHSALDCRFTITSLTIPALLEEEFAPAEAAVDVFLAEWKAAYPRQPLGKASYAKIQEGFRKKLCYITTAACSRFGEDDDCTALREFRAFRDGWLALTPGGKEKITEYYLFAPLIVDAIDSSGVPEQEYRSIWSGYLGPCLSDLDRGDMETCACRYERMVRSLEEKWLS